MEVFDGGRESSSNLKIYDVMSRLPYCIQFVLVRRVLLFLEYNARNGIMVDCFE